MYYLLQQFGEEMRSKERDIEELQKTMQQLGDKSADHPVHKTVGEVTTQYQTINDKVKSRAEMLAQFKPRVMQYEQLMEECTQWWNDCCKRVDELPVVDMATDQLLQQLKDVEVRQHVC